jgi:hypothetical protein
MGKQLYKVLRSGKSFHGGSLKWSLPKGKEPGKWHEVEGPLERCRNGLHLTDDPLKLLPDEKEDPHIQVFAVETDGEVIDFDGEFVARRVRLLREVTPRKRAVSGAMKLIKLVWGHNREATGHSWQRLNGSMAESVTLAINAGMFFNINDIVTLRATMRLSYWGSPEQWYALAIKVGHRSACQALEAYFERPPFFYAGARVGVGTRLDDWRWRVSPEVTSFSADGTYLTACVYAWEKDNRKPVRRLKITLAEFRARERLRELARKNPTTVYCLACAMSRAEAEPCECGSKDGIRGDRVGTLAAREAVPA